MIVRNVPQQCPHCTANGSITLTLRATLEGIASECLCTNCDHQWSKLQSLVTYPDAPVREGARQYSARQRPTIRVAS